MFNSELGNYIFCWINKQLLLITCVPLVKNLNIGYSVSFWGISSKWYSQDTNCELVYYNTYSQVNSFLFILIISSFYSLAIYFGKSSILLSQITWINSSYCVTVSTF